MDFQVFASLLPLYVVAFGLLGLFIPLILLSWLITGLSRGTKLGALFYAVRVLSRR